MVQGLAGCITLSGLVSTQQGLDFSLSNSNKQPCVITITVTHYYQEIQTLLD